MTSGTEQEDAASWLVARLAPLVGRPASEVSREELFSAWGRFIELLAGTRPLVLVVEDVHWADAALLDFLEHVVEHSGAPVMVVATARPEVVLSPTWRAVPLAPLTDDETGRLVEAALGDRDLPDGVRRALLTKAAGNPLYAREYLHLLTNTSARPHQGSKGSCARPPPRSTLYRRHGPSTPCRRT